jgi:hypothetical protein
VRDLLVREGRLGIIGIGVSGLDRQVALDLVELSVEEEPVDLSEKCLAYGVRNNCLTGGRTG